MLLWGIVPESDRALCQQRSSNFPITYFPPPKRKQTQVSGNVFLPTSDSFVSMATNPQAVSVKKNLVNFSMRTSRCGLKCDRLWMLIITQNYKWIGTQHARAKRGIYYSTFVCPEIFLKKTTTSEFLHLTPAPHIYEHWYISPGASGHRDIKAPCISEGSLWISLFLFCLSIPVIVHLFVVIFVSLCCARSPF